MDLNAELLARLLRGESVDGYQMGRGNAIYDPSAGLDGPQQFEDVIYGNTSKDGWTTNKWGTWNKDGTFRGSGSGDSDALSTLKFLATAAAGYYGGNALAGMGEGAAAGGLGDLAATDLGIGAVSTGGGGAGALGSAGGAAGSLGSLGSAGSTASALSSLADAGKTAASGLNMGGVLGAAAGALSSKDQQQTTSRDPWAPAQPMLKGLIDQLPALQQQYAQQPFNGAQQAGYNNMAGLLDLVNKNAGGLLGGFQANASGANQFRRGVPQQGLIGSSFNPSPQEWNPQSYGRFGG